MKVLLSSLQKFIDLSGIDPKKLAADMTMGGLKIDAVEYLGHGLEGVVTGRIEKIEKHPNAEKLTVCSIDAGSEKLSIVCGAKNMAEGDVVPVATIGAKLPCGIEIKQADLRGVTSRGMLCSEKELGLAKESSGLLILPRDTAPGVPFARHIDRDDWLFDVDVTAQRGDAMSVLGVARDLSAIYKKPLKMPEVKLAEDATKKTSGEAEITIEAKDLCKRYVGRVVDGVKVGPSPAWLAATIEKIGQRPVNNVVDVTNYATYMFGHPSHAFDYARLASGKITVRRAKAGEKLIAIDKREYALGEDMLAICDANGPVAIAGVMGGLDSEVGGATTKLLLEVAAFDPISVRRTSKKLNLASESSTRFARGINLEDSEFVMDFIAATIAELSPGAKVYSGACDVGEKKVPERKVSFKMKDLCEFVGHECGLADVMDILGRLSFAPAESGGAVTVTVPPYRHDISLPCDLYEEFLRIFGYNNIPEVGLVTPYAKPIESSYPTMRKVIDLMVASGFSQCMNYSFIGEGDVEKTGFAGVEKDLWVRVMNPLGAEFSVMRPTMLFGLLNNLAFNRNQKLESARIFEIGSKYRLSSEIEPAADFKKDHVPAVECSGGARRIIETQCIAGLMFGSASESQWNGAKGDYDFYRLKGVLENLFSAMRLPVEFVPEQPNAMLHPKKSAAIKLRSGKTIGFAGVLHPVAAKRFDVDYGREVIVFEIGTEELIGSHEKPFRMKEISKFPASVYDLAVVIPKEVTYREIEKACRKAGGQNLRSVVPFDEYTGERVPEGKKSVAFTLVFQSNEGTLSDAETKKSFDAVISAVRETLGGELRS